MADAPGRARGPELPLEDRADKNCEGRGAVLGFTMSVTTAAPILTCMSRMTASARIRAEDDGCIRESRFRGRQWAMRIGMNVPISSNAF